MDTATDTAGDQASALTRWECTCTRPPVLLGLVGPSGVLHIKVRDRYWWVDHGHVRTACPRCGQEHSLNVQEVR